MSTRNGTDMEMAAEALPPTERAGGPLRLHFSTRRDILLKRRALHNFLIRDAVEDGQTYLRPTRDTSKAEPWVRRMEVHATVQAVPAVLEAATQTRYFRRVNAAVQAVPEAADAPPITADGANGTTSADGLRAFFAKSVPRMLHHLTQSATVPLFRDDYAALSEDDAVVGSREDSFLREMGNFVHRYTRDRHVVSLDWRPGPRPVVVVASISNKNLTHRVDAARTCEPCVALVWNFAEQANPQFLLEAPAEVLCVRYHPQRPNLIAGGLITGQVVLWDTNVAPADKRQKVGGPLMRLGGAAGGSTAAATNADGTAAPAASGVGRPEDPTVLRQLPPPIKGHTLERCGDFMVSRLQPILLSRIENGHRRAVHDIQWLPDNLELGFDLKAVPAEQLNQFASMSEDGSMCVWDVRPDRLPQDKLRQLRHQGRVAGDTSDAARMLWVPQHRYVLTRPSDAGGGEMLGLRVALEGRAAAASLGSAPAAGGSSAAAPSHTFFCTSVEGELGMGTWGSRPGADGQVSSYDAQNGAASPLKERVIRQVAQAHDGPAWGLQRHPLLPDFYLTVGDWGFKVWRAGLAAPILSAPAGEQQTTCGRWSRTRAGVVFIGTRDGFIQVWDLLDRTHEPVLVHAAIQGAVSCLELRPAHAAALGAASSGARTGATGRSAAARAAAAAAAAQQQIVLGTRQGSFHLYDLPRVLVRGPTNELAAVRTMFEREARRVSYFQWRWAERRREVEQQQSEGADGEGGSDAARAGGATAGHATTSAAWSPDEELLGRGPTGAEDDTYEADFTFRPEDNTAFLALVEELAKVGDDIGVAA
jgi:hypothetical protein